MDGHIELSRCVNDQTVHIDYRRGYPLRSCLRRGYCRRGYPWRQGRHRGYTGRGNPKEVTPEGVYLKWLLSVEFIPVEVTSEELIPEEITLIISWRLTPRRTDIVNGSRVMFSTESTSISRTNYFFLKFYIIFNHTQSLNSVFSHRSFMGLLRTDYLFVGWVLWGSVSFWFGTKHKL